MDSGGYILLFIVVACVIALVYIARKQKSLDEPVDIKPIVSSGTSGSTSSTAGGTSDKPEEVKPSGPQQNTIYEFSAKNTKRRCPFCDGENSAGEKVCNICGRDL